MPPMGNTAVGVFFFFCDARMVQQSSEEYSATNVKWNLKVMLLSFILSHII